MPSVNDMPMGKDGGAAAATTGEAVARRRVMVNQNARE